MFTPVYVIFFFNDTATTEIYTLSLHDALPISHLDEHGGALDLLGLVQDTFGGRSEEHTSELQSPDHLVCRLLLEKKKKISISIPLIPPSSTTYTSRTPHRRYQSAPAADRLT